MKLYRGNRQFLDQLGKFILFFVLVSFCTIVSETHGSDSFVWERKAQKPKIENSDRSHAYLNDREVIMNMSFKELQDELVRSTEENISLRHKLKQLTSQEQNKYNVLQQEKLSIVDELITQINELKKRDEKKIEQISFLCEENGQYQKEYLDMKGSYHELLNKIEMLTAKNENEIKGIEADIFEKEKIIGNLEEQIGNRDLLLKQTLEAGAKNREEYASQLEKYQEMNESLFTDLSNWKGAMQEKEEEMHRLQDNIALLEEQVAQYNNIESSLKEKLLANQEKLQKDQNNYAKACQELQRENDYLNKSLQDKHSYVKELEERLQHHEEILHEAIAMESKNKEEIQEQLQIALEEVNKKVTLLDGAYRKNDSLSNELVMNNQQIDRIKQEFYELSEAYDKVIGTLDTYRDSHQNQLSEIQKKDEIISALEETHRNILIENQELKSENQNIETYEETIATLEREKDALKESIEHHQTALSDLEDRLKIRDSQFEEELASVNETKANFQERIHELENEIEKVHERLIVESNQKQELEEMLGKQVDAINKIYAEKQEREAAYKEKVLSLQDKEKEKQNQIVQLEREIMGLRTTIDENDQLVTDLEERLERRNDLLQESIVKEKNSKEDYEYEMGLLSGKIKELEQSLANEIEENDSLSGQLAGLNETLTSAQHDFEKKMQQHTSLLAQNEREIGEWRKAAYENKDIVTEFRGHLEEKESLLLEYVDKLENIQLAYENERQQWRDHLAGLESKIEEQQTNYESKIAENTEIKANIEHKVSELENEIAKLLQDSKDKEELAGLLKVKDDQITNLTSLSSALEEKYLGKEEQARMFEEHLRANESKFLEKVEQLNDHISQNHEKIRNLEKYADKYKRERKKRLEREELVKKMTNLLKEQNAQLQGLRINRPEEERRESA